MRPIIKGDEPLSLAKHREHHTVISTTIARKMNYAERLWRNNGQFVAIACAASTTSDRG